MQSDGEDVEEREGMMADEEEQAEGGKKVAEEVS